MLPSCLNPTRHPGTCGCGRADDRQRAPAKRTRAKRASYREAVEWIAYNDSPAEDGLDEEAVSLLVTTCLVADIFGKPQKEVGRDVVRLRRKHDICG